MYAARLSFGVPLLMIRLPLDENGAEMHNVLSLQVFESVLSPGVIRHAPELWRRTVAP